MVNMKSVLLAFTIGLGVSAPGPAVSCGDLEENRHIGRLVVIDWENDTFTILDRESGRPISFVTTSERLRGLALVRLPLEVRFEYLAGRLEATSVRVYAMM